MSNYFVFNCIYVCKQKEARDGMKRKREDGKRGWMIGKCSKEIWVRNLMMAVTLTWPCKYYLLLFVVM